jgi:hypothetical protein
MTNKLLFIRYLSGRTYSFTANVHHLEDTQTLPLSCNFANSQCIFGLFGTSLSGYTLVDAT